MEKIFNMNTLFGIVIGGIVFGVLGVTASNMYQANQVSYKDGNVESALNDLYNVADLNNKIVC